MKKILSALVAVLIILVFVACDQGPAPAVQEISLDRPVLGIQEGHEAKLTATVVADSGADTTVTWSTSDESIATVNAEGAITAKAIGAATITARAGDKSAQCMVIVSPEVIPVESVSVDRPFAFICKGDTIKLNAIVKPEDATYSDVEWKSGDEAIATVTQNGEVKGIAEGMVEISVTVKDKTGKCLVMVMPERKPVTSIVLDRDYTSVAKGATTTLKATVTPEDATYYKITWKSSNESVVTVNDGVLTGVSAGFANITAKAGDEIAVCMVVVSSEGLSVTYDANDGSGKQWNQLFPKDLISDLAGLMFSRDDYVFTGWNTEKEGTGDVFCDGEAVVFSGNKTLYAQWVEKDFYSIGEDGTLGRGSEFDPEELPANICLPRTIDGKQVTIIGDGLFNNDDRDTWKDIKQIKVPDGVTQIGSKVFNSCHNLEWLHLPRTLEGFNANSFTRNRKMHFKVDSANRLYTTDEDGKQLLSPDKTVLYSYPSCPNKLEIGEGIKEIGANAFCYIPLETLELPYGLDKIGDWAFYEIDIQRVTIPGSVTEIGQYAFAETDHLEEVLFSAVDGKKLKSLGPSAFYNSNVNTVEFQNPVGTIGESAFNNCNNLETVRFMKKVDMVGTYAFRMVQYTGGEGLSLWIYFYSKPPKTGHDVFDLAHIKQIRVQPTMVEKYKKAPEWEAQAQYISSM